MFSRKTVFSRPLVTNSFQKDSRVYPDPVPVKNCNKMSVEKPQSKSTEKKITESLPAGSIQKMHPMAIIGANSQTKSFYFTTKDPAPQVGVDPADFDNTLIWQYDVSLLGTPDKTKQLIFRKNFYYIPGWISANFYSVIYIVAEGFQGYLNQTGCGSTCVAALTLQQMNPVEDDAGNIVHDLVYTLEDPKTWQIPSTITSLKFHIRFGQADEHPAQQPYATLPLSNPISFNFDIKTI